MNSVGIDLHRKRSHVAVLEERGAQLLSRRIVNDRQAFLELLAGIEGEPRIALEAAYGWEWLADALPGGTGGARGPPAAARQPAVADRRFRPRDRPDQRRDRPARQGRRLRRSALPDPRCRALHRDAGDRRDWRHRPLPSARHLCAWAGLAPTVRGSDGKARLGHITGQGSPALRWALVEAAQHSARGGGPLRQAYERISKRRGKSVAKVAVARKILTLCFYGLRDGEIRCLTPRAKVRTIRTVAVKS
jgi:transposase